MKSEKEALITESKIFWNQGDLRKESTGGLKRLQAKMFVPVEVSIDSTTILSTYY